MDNLIDILKKYKKDMTNSAYEELYEKINNNSENEEKLYECKIIYNKIDYKPIIVKKNDDYESTDEEENEEKNEEIFPYKIELSNGKIILSFMKKDIKNITDEIEKNGASFLHKGDFSYFFYQIIYDVLKFDNFGILSIKEFTDCVEI